MPRFRAVLVRLALLLLGLAAHAPVQAQAPVILAPPDRLIFPGEFVTLVFRVEADVALAAVASATSASGWPILRQPGTLELPAGGSVPVPVTVAVPADAQAARRERVTLRVDTAALRLESTVELTVAEVVSFSLEAPTEVTLALEGIKVVVGNVGNTPAEAELRVLRGGEVLLQRFLSLAPGARLEEVVSLPSEGRYTLELISERGVELQRPVNVVRFGVAPPDPLRLAAELSASISSTGAYQMGFALKGALSDFSSLDLRLEAPTWQRSYAELAHEQWSLRLGGGWRDPFRLGLPADFGLAGNWQLERWGVAAALGGLEGERFSGVLAGAYTPPGYRVAGALGMREGSLLAQVRAEAELLEGARLTAELGYRQGGMSAALSGEVDGRFRGGVGLQELGLATARLSVKADYRWGDATVYGDVIWPLAIEEGLAGRLGVSAPLPTALPGRLSAQGQLGAPESFFRLSYRTVLPAWGGDNAFGVRYDPFGLGLTLDSLWVYRGSSQLSLEARLRYYFTGFLDGRFGVRYRQSFDLFALALSGSWNLREQAVGSSATLSWLEGPWRVNLNLSLGYSYQPALSERFSLSVALSGTYAFAVEVPEALVAAAGGRRLGVLVGAVQAGGAPLPNVIVTLGPYRLRSDAEGRFRAEVPPGRYRLAVDPATVPLAYRLIEAEKVVEVHAQAVTTVTIAAVATSALRGWVLEDSAGDGVPDEPPRGVSARLRLTDAEGLQRMVATDERGRFEVRGLLPGPVTVQLIELPLGSAVIGDEQQAVQLEPGAPAELTFLVQPVTARVQAFAAQALRIRRLSLEVERIPPGTAPLVQLEVQGEADSVQVRTPDAVHNLAPDEDGLWAGRVEVPLNAPPGVYSLTVVARANDTEVTRRAQFFVDPSAPAWELSSNAPRRPGEALRVEVTTYFAADEIRVSQPFGADLALTEVAPGRWLGTLAIPDGADDAVYALTVSAVATDGRVFEQTLRFRVLAP